MADFFKFHRNFSHSTGMWVYCEGCLEAFVNQLLVQIDTECEGLLGGLYLCSKCVDFINNAMKTAESELPKDQT